MYEKSYMHRDTVTHVVVSEPTDFIITASVDGYVKFWKKGQKDIEFAKQFKAHLGPIKGASVSSDGSLYASISSDKTVKIFDIATFDLIAMIRLPFEPGCVQWIFSHGGGEQKIAVSDNSQTDIYVYDVRSGTNEPLGVAKVHAAPVVAMAYNTVFDIVISADTKGKRPLNAHWNTGIIEHYHLCVS